KPKRYHPGLYKFNFRKIIERFKSCKSSLDKLNTLSKRNKWKFLLISGGVVVYGIFLAWVFPKVSFDEFMFFILLLYIPLSLRLKLDSRYPIVVGLLLLVVCVVVLIQGFEDYANRIAIYAYYFLVIGVALLFIDYLREPKREI
ncbi:MAG: hypothetical protein ISS28_01390, partial [Candidatus Cloacimonetes bacterium]|nr:hypothetical protein [Candidatus Cloacimonadota bacterium]